MVAEENYVSYVSRFADTVLRIAVNYCKELSDAEDMVQDVFLKLYETKTDFADDEHVKRWLIRVTVNTCKNHLASTWQRRLCYTRTAPFLRRLPHFLKNTTASCTCIIMRITP